MDPLRRFRQLAARQHGLVTRTQALASGLTRHQVDGLVRGASLERVYAGIYRVSGTPHSWKQAVMAACLAAGPDAAASHLTAARLWDLPVPPSGIDLVVPVSRRPRLRGAVVHRVAIGPRDRARLNGSRSRPHSAL